MSFSWFSLDIFACPACHHSSSFSWCLSVAGSEPTGNVTLYVVLWYIRGNFNLFIKKGGKVNSCKRWMCKEHECMCLHLPNTFHQWEKWMKKLFILNSHYFQPTHLSNSLYCDIFEVSDFSLSHKGHAAGSLHILYWGGDCWQYLRLDKQTCSVHLF